LKKEEDKQHDRICVPRPREIEKKKLRGNSTRKFLRVFEKTTTKTRNKKLRMCLVPADLRIMFIMMCKVIF
jgi:hypothetical protein